MISDHFEKSVDEEGVSLKADARLLRKVKTNGGCLCKFRTINVVRIPEPCPCDEPFNLKEGEYCHCRLYSREEVKKS